MSIARTLVAVLLVAGCGSSEPLAPSPSPSTSSGVDRFLDDMADENGLGGGRYHRQTHELDQAALAIGRTICDGLADGSLTYMDAVDAQRISARMTADQAAVVVRSAVRNLCPAEQGQLPS